MSHTTRPRRIAILAMLVPALLALSACFSIENSYVVNEDGSGTQTIRLAIPADLATSFGDGEELPSEEELAEDPGMESLREALGDDGSVEVFSNEEDGIGYVLTIEVEPSDDFGEQLRQTSERISSVLPEDDDSGDVMEMVGTDFTLRRDGDGWVYEQEMTSISPELMGELAGTEEGTNGEDAAEMAQFASMFAAQSSITIRLDLPGEVTEHNADEVEDDGTLVWNQSGAAEPRTLTARSEIGGGGLSTLAQAGLMIGAIAIVLVVAGFFLFRRRSAI